MTFYYRYKYGNTLYAAHARWSSRSDFVGWVEDTNRHHPQDQVKEIPLSCVKKLFPDYNVWEGTPRFWPL